MCFNQCKASLIKLSHEIRESECSQHLPSEKDQPGVEIAKPLIIKLAEEPLNQSTKLKSGMNPQPIHGLFNFNYHLIGGG